MVCVVETGIPICPVKNKVNAPAVSAATPSRGVTLVILDTHCFNNFPSTTHGTHTNS